MNARTGAAKTVFWISGRLSRVRTYQRTWKMADIDLDSDEPFKTEPGGRHWLPCRLSVNLLNLSLHLDPAHWDHWALDHEGGRCQGAEPCAVCGGIVCEAPSEEGDFDTHPVGNSPFNTA